MQSHTTVVIREVEGSAYSARIEVGNHQFVADEPLSFEGGGDLGPSPYDLLASSLAACTVMTVRWYARKKNLPLTSVDAVVRFDQQQGHFVKEVALHGDLTSADRKRLLEVAKACPVQKTLLGQITIETLGKEQAA